MAITDSTLDALRASSASGASDPLIAALQALYRAFQKSSIYPSGHPSIPEAVHKAARDLQQALEGRPSLLVGVARDQLLHLDRKLSEATGSLRSLALLLHQLDVAALEFQAGLVAAELQMLVELLGQARRDKIKGVKLVELLAAANVPHLRISPIDYRALRFSDGASRERGEDDDGNDSWINLTRTLTDPATYGTDVQLEALAQEASQRIESHEGAGVGALRRQMQEAASPLPSMRPDERQIVRRRLAGFLSQLHVGLRHDLLRVDAAAPRASISFLSEMAEDLPLADLLAALREVDRAGARVPDEMLSLINKLARISESRPQDSGLLQRTLQDWGLTAGVALPAETRGDLAEVLQRRSETEYNPDSYRALLSDLARHDLPGVAQASALRYRDPTDPIDVRLHAAEIAVLLLERPEGDEHRKNLLAFIQGATGFLLEQDRYGTVHDATVAARAHCLLKTDSEETRRAARGFLDGFTRPERIEAILTPARRGDPVPDDALRLLSLGGAEALDRVLDVLGERPTPEVAATLRCFARERGSDMLGRVIDARSARGKAALDPLFPILRELTTAEAVPLLDRLAQHEDVKVRREALVLLCEIDDRAGTPELHLRRALCDPQETLSSWAIQRLSERETRAAFDLLGEYLEGGLPDVEPALGLSRRAAQSLLARGSFGRDRLCRALRLLLRSPSPLCARQARILAELLAAEAADPAVSRSLWHWRFSLNRVVGLLVGTRDGSSPEPRA